ncbi:MAG: NAD-dependent dehydratase [Erythrobacter sp.]|nr:NAD-dependent dehydratase [Erythrobacter sp.]
MNILLLGASGFIGSALGRELLREGHDVITLGRNPRFGQALLPAAEWRRGDLRQMIAPADWRELLAGIEVVINAAGALQTGLRDDVDKVQHLAMAAMFEMAGELGVRHVVQISAAGADTESDTLFMTSKARADAILAASGLAYTILRPGLVIGRNAFGGTEMLRIAAAAPMRFDIVGARPIRCTALSDVIAAVQVALADPARCRGIFDLVGRETQTLGELIATHRQWLGFAPHLHGLRLPIAALAFVGRLADALGWLGWRSPLRSTALAALTAGIDGEPDDAARLLGRDALSLPRMFEQLGGAGKADRWHARLAGLFPVALLALGLLWLGSGILGFLQTDAASTLLVDGGISVGTARASVISGSIGDLAIALGLIWRPTVMAALRASIFLTLAYLAGSLAIRPDLWLDPLGPMLKVLPILALTAICLAISEER